MEIQCSQIVRAELLGIHFFCNQVYLIHKHDQLLDVLAFEFWPLLPIERICESDDINVEGDERQNRSTTRENDTYEVRVTANLW